MRAKNCQKSEMRVKKMEGMIHRSSPKSLKNKQAKKAKSRLEMLKTVCKQPKKHIRSLN